MSKTSLALAAACLALMSVGASAQDNSSYESRGYGGPLGVGPNFHQGGQSAPPVYDSGSRASSYSTERYRAQQRLDRVERKRSNDDGDVKTAKSPPASSKDNAQNENSSIVSIASDKDKVTPVTESAKSDTAKSDTAKADSAKSRNENSTIASVAASATAKVGPVKAEVTKADTDASAKPTGCKRYFPTVGQTLSVPCD